MAWEHGAPGAHPGLYDQFEAYRPGHPAPPTGGVVTPHEQLRIVRGEAPRARGISPHDQLKIIRGE